MEFIGGRSVIEKTNAEDAKVSPRAAGDLCLFCGLCVRGLGFAEFFGEGFAVAEGDGVEAVEDYDVEAEGGDG